MFRADSGPAFRVLATVETPVHFAPRGFSNNKTPGYMNLLALETGQFANKSGIWVRPVSGIPIALLLIRPGAARSRPETTSRKILPLYSTENIVNLLLVYNADRLPC
jgi:hypothetical protein